ncbi:MAG: GlyGly-CTERM sorting domain-containing protein [Myxococcales bacterium]|nr:GlyGly-CTERM sorting domain-containing protein [Myxococcales bacterium]
MSEPRPPEEPCRYAAGLPHQARRPLAAHDRAWIERRLRRLWIGTVLALLGVLVVVAAAVALGQRAPTLARPLGGGLGLSLCALGAVGVLGCLTARRPWRWLAIAGLAVLGASAAARPWLPAWSPPRWLVAEVLVGTTALGLSAVGLWVGRRVRLLRLSSLVRGELAEGELDRFEGPCPEGPLDALLARLRTAGELRDRSGLRLELLPRSGLLVRVGGRRFERWETAHVVDVAPAQPHALRVELPQGVAPATPDPRLCLRRRSLTPLERAELQRHIAQLRRRWWPAAALTVLVLALMTWTLRSDAAVSDSWPLLDGASLGWLALLVVVYVGYARRVLAARKLEHDRRLRWVVTVHHDTADPQHDPPTLEVLPISQLAWTEHATPAGWRLSRL